MADSDPTTYFRPKWHQAYWQRHRLFQSNAPGAFVPAFKRRALPPGLFAPMPGVERRRRFSPTVFIDPYTGSISLLWGI